MFFHYRRIKYKILILLFVKKKLQTFFLEVNISSESINTTIKKVDRNTITNVLSYDVFKFI